jgi:hypothetical protein
MKLLFADTDANTESQYLAMWRGRRDAEKLRSLNGLNAAMRSLMLGDLANHAGPPATTAARRRRVAARLALAGLFPEDVALDHDRHDAPEGERSLMQPDAVAVTLLVTAVLEELGVPYVIGGSLAGAVHGIPRATNDSDLIIMLERGQEDVLATLVARLESEFLVTLSGALDAMAHHGSFNLIHHASLFKVDVFIPRARAFERARFARGQARVLAEDPTRTATLSTPEDTVLAKLEWYRLGNEVSDRQWNDIQGILKLQGAALDHPYLTAWARNLGVSDLLARAFDEAGIVPRDGGA